MTRFTLHHPTTGCKTWFDIGDEVALDSPKAENIARAAYQALVKDVYLARKWNYAVLRSSTAGKEQRIWFSAPGDPEAWSPWDVGLWVDYRCLRSWLQHPLLTFRWWRTPR